MGLGDKQRGGGKSGGQASTQPKHLQLDSKPQSPLRIFFNTRFHEHFKSKRVAKTYAGSYWHEILTPRALKSEQVVLGV